MHIIIYINRNVSSLINSFQCKLLLLLLYDYNLSIRKGTLILKYTYINSIFNKTKVQTVLYLLSIFWFSLWIHVTNRRVNIFKCRIHSLLIFRWRKNNIQGLFDQRKFLFVIGIIYPTSSNTFGVIVITSCFNQLTNITWSLIPFKITNSSIFI